jgi:exopolyphosphatase/guanosine-5'-triphosphate,3'-diphosphate pyrophosphatase
MLNNKPTCNGARLGAGNVSAPVLAALDLGTNNCRLLVAVPDATQPQGFRVEDAFSRIVRLGEGLSRQDALQDDAIERTLEALGICQRKMVRHNVTHARAVATEACRRASNGAAFLAKASSLLGVQIEMIASAEEARLAMLGCAPLLHGEQPYALMFDIGGGSTELIWMKVAPSGTPELIDHLSLACGVVSFTEEFGGDKVEDETYQRMVKQVHDQLQDFSSQHGIMPLLQAGKVQMVGSSGTVTTLAGVLRGLKRYQRSVIDGCIMQVTDARQVTEQIRHLDFAGRSEIPCIGEERADLVVAGCAILQAIYETWPVQQFRIGDRGLREGILSELLAAL